VSDVILYAGHRAVAGGLQSTSTMAPTSCACSPTPGAKRASYVAQLDREGEDLATLSPGAKVSAGRIPDELNVDGSRLRLRKRGRASVRTEGESLPPHTAQADYVLLGDPSGRLLLVIDFVGGERLALSGERVPRGNAGRAARRQLSPSGSGRQPVSATARGVPSATMDAPGGATRAMRGREGGHA
jgi:hypothetical protein